MLAREKSHPRLENNKGFDLLTTKSLFIITGLILIIAFYVVWNLRDKVNYLEKETKSVSELIVQNQKNIKPEMIIPTMDELPDMLQRCKDTFLLKGVQVKALNVERFSELKGVNANASLDYALVRLGLEGTWEQVKAGIIELENFASFPVHLQEVTLNKKGGEILLQVYFKHRS